MDTEGSPPVWSDDGYEGEYGILDMLLFRWVIRFF